MAGNPTPLVFLKEVPDGIADDAVPALPAVQPHECLSEPGSVAWSNTTETQNEMIVVLQSNQRHNKLLSVASL